MSTVNSMQLLLDSLQRSEHRVFTPSEIARALNVSDQVVTNWCKRGISTEGALAAQLVFQKDANFILGRIPHPMMEPMPQPGELPQSAVIVAGEPEVKYLSKTNRDKQHEEIVELFDQLDSDSKIEALADLRGFVRGRRPLKIGRAPTLAEHK